MRRALAWSASDESDMAVPSSSGREYDGVTQGGTESNTKRPISEVAIAKQIERILKPITTIHAQDAGRVADMWPPARTLPFDSSSAAGTLARALVPRIRVRTTLQELSHVTQKEDKWKAEYKYCFEPLQIIVMFRPDNVNLQIVMHLQESELCLRTSSVLGVRTLHQLLQSVRRQLHL